MTLRRILAFSLAIVLCVAATSQTNHIKRPTKKRPATTQVEPKKSKPKKTQSNNSSKPKANNNPIVQTSPYTPQVRSFNANGVRFEMVEVRGGTFRMGATSEQGSDAYSDEKPVHSVTLDSYYIGKTEVTQALWKAVMGSNPSKFKGDDLPVECVSWEDCQTFIEKLNALTGRSFRLPTEAEWEFACRGGKNSRGYKYSGSDDINRVAWYSDNSGSRTHIVATKTANELGVYDMIGNVDEWCADWYGDYSSRQQHNPSGATSGKERVGRGSGWGNTARDCRSSTRGTCAPSSRGNGLGFRLVL